MIYTPKSVQRGEGFGGRKEEEAAAYEEYKRAVLRVLVRVKSPKVLRLMTETNEKVRISTKLQTWEHLLLFESDLTAATPLKSEYKLEQYQEWLGWFRREVQGGKVDVGGLG